MDEDDFDFKDLLPEGEEDDWDFHASPCANCGSVGWTKGKVDDEGSVIFCDLCPKYRVRH